MKALFSKMWDEFKGWIASYQQPDYTYQYVIDGIEMKPSRGVYIRYKLVGCRTPMVEPASHLNSSHLFSLFRPDHAQIIVSIATIEALLHRSPTEIMERYQRYINLCAAQFVRK